MTDDTSFGTDEDEIARNVAAGTPPESTGDGGGKGILGVVFDQVGELAQRAMAAGSKSSVDPDATATTAGRVVDAVARAGKTVVDTVGDQIPANDPPAAPKSPGAIVRDVFDSAKPDHDTDHDGLSNAQEQVLGTSPLARDSDGDGLSDGDEFKRGTSPTAADTDHDGLQDGTERRLGLDPRRADSDGDGIGDLGDTIIDTAAKALRAGSGSTARPASGGSKSASKPAASTESTPTGAPATAAGTAAASPGTTSGTTSGIEQGDSDEDGLTDVAEADRGTDPFDPDTDRDGLGDAYEVREGTDPTRADTDGDGLGDNLEIDKTSPTKADTDGDGVDDGDEYVLGLDPTKTDTDGDGRSDRDELDHPDDTGAAATTPAAATNHDATTPDATTPDGADPALTDPIAASTSSTASAAAGTGTGSTAKVPEPQVLLERAAQLRAEAAEQRRLAVERNVSDNARFDREGNARAAETEAMKARIASDVESEAGLRHGYVEANDAAKGFEADAVAAEKAGDHAQAEELREHAQYQRVRAESLLNEANELQDRTVQSRVDLLEIEQAGLRAETDIRAANRAYNTAEAELDKMDRLASELETAGRKALAATATESIPERAGAELEAEAAWGRAQQITLDADKVASFTGDAVDVPTELPPTTSDATAANDADPMGTDIADDLTAMNIPTAPTPFVDGPQQPVGPESTPTSQGVLGSDDVQPADTPAPAPSGPSLDDTTTPPAGVDDPDEVDFGDGTLRAPTEPVPMPEPELAPVDPGDFDASGDVMIADSTALGPPDDLDGFGEA